MNPFRDLPHPAQRLKPMKEMDLQELMHSVVVTKLSAALLEMLYPIEACVLNLWRKTLLHLRSLYASYMHFGSASATDVLLEGGGHKPDTAISQHLMRLLRVHPEVWISTPVLVKEEAAKCRVMQTEWVVLVRWNIQY